MKSKDLQLKQKKNVAKYLIVASSFSNSSILAIYTVITLLNSLIFIIIF